MVVPEPRCDSHGEAASIAPERGRDGRYAERDRGDEAAEGPSPRRAFYQALAYGRTVQAASEQSRVGRALEMGAGADLLVLLVPQWHRCFETYVLFGREARGRMPLLAARGNQ